MQILGQSLLTCAHDRADQGCPGTTASDIRCSLRFARPALAQPGAKTTGVGYAHHAKRKYSQPTQLAMTNHAVVGTTSGTRYL